MITFVSKDTKDMSETKNEPSGEAVTRRAISFPQSLYLDMVDENTRNKRKGIKRNTEEEIISLVGDGLRFRKAIEAINEYIKGLPDENRTKEIMRDFRELLKLA